MKLSLSDKAGEKHEIASFSQRATAIVIDFVIIGVVAFIFNFFAKEYISVLFAPKKGSTEPNFNNSSDMLFLDPEFFFYCFAMILAIIPFYHILLEQSKMQGSLGKWMMHSKVVNKEAERISLKGSIIRNFIKFYGLIIIPLAIMLKVIMFPPAFLISFWVVLAWLGEEDRYGRLLSDFPAGSFVIAA